MSMRIGLVLATLTVSSSLLGCVPRALIEDAKDRDNDDFVAAELGGPDCDDAEPAVNPDADEICGDGVDNDCDGETDDDGIGATTFFRDVDSDGYGRLESSVSACTMPEGYVPNSADCDDGDRDVHPGADELCGSIDEDCDGDTEANAVNPTTWYLDADGDDFGTDATTIVQCEPPAGYVGQAGDCDDARSHIHPEQVEVCNGWDDDCNDLLDAADPGMAGLQTWYQDTDGDGYGVSGATQSSCTQPDGYVPVAGDCNPGSAAVHPGATEICNASVDDDCDSLADDADPSVDLTNAPTWYLDADDDGYGVGAGSKHCTSPSGDHVQATGDCLDSGAFSALTYPGAAEGCDGLRTNCDLPSVPAPEIDNDGDGYVECNVAAGPGWRAGGTPPNGLDCDDTSPWGARVRPGATESCDGVINDCTLLALPVIEVDNDGDGYVECTVTGISSWHGAAITDGGDCDDTTLSAATVYPGAPEICDGGLNDCEGTLPSDEADIDGDDWAQCSPLDGPVWRGGLAGGGDCQDQLGAQAIHPGASEVCGDGIDNDCDEGHWECRFPAAQNTSQADSVLTGNGTDISKLGRQVFVGNHDDDGLGDIFALSGSAVFTGEDTPTRAAGGAVVILPNWVSPVTVPRPSRDVFIPSGSGTRVEGILPCDLDSDGVDDIVFARDAWVNPFNGPWRRSGDEPYAFLGPVAPGSHSMDDADVKWSHSGGATNVSASGLRLATCGTFVGGSFMDDLVMTNAEIFYGPSVAGPATDLDTPDATLSPGGVIGRGDADGDLDDEVLIGISSRDSGKGAVFVVDDPGTGTISLLSPHAVGSTTSTALGSSVGSGDLDGDGNPDLVAGSANGIYIWLDAVGGLNTDNADHLISGTGLSVVAVSDMDGDFRDDLLVRNNAPNPDEYVVVYSDPGWGPTVDLSVYPRIVPAGAHGVLASAALGDLNGDGFPEVIIGAPDANTYGSVFVFVGDGR